MLEYIGKMKKQIRRLLFPLFFGLLGASISSFVVCKLIFRFSATGNWVVWVVKSTVPQAAMVIPYVIPRFFFKQKGVRALFHVCLLVAIFVCYSFLSKNSDASFSLHSALIINIAAISGISALCVCSLFLDPRENLRKALLVLAFAILVRFIYAWGVRGFSFHFIAMAETFSFLGLGVGLVFGDLVAEKKVRLCS